jgi:hypothetical protein
MDKEHYRKLAQEYEAAGDAEPDSKHQQLHYTMATIYFRLASPTFPGIPIKNQITKADSKANAKFRAEEDIIIRKMEELTDDPLF